MGRAKVINVNELREILRKEFNSDYCHIDGIDIVTKDTTPFNPGHVKIGAGRVLNIHFDLGESYKGE